MDKKIQKVAEDFQAIARQIKALQAKEKPLKAQLLAFADDNRDAFDEAFQIKFPNGTYLAKRVADALEGSPEAKELLAERLYDNADFFEVKLNEKKVIEESIADTMLRKELTNCGISIGQKETVAVYAG